MPVLWWQRWAQGTSFSVQNSFWLAQGHPQYTSQRSCSHFLTETPRVSPPNLTQCTQPRTACRGGLSYVSYPPRLIFPGRPQRAWEEVQGHGVWVWSWWPEGWVGTAAVNQRGSVIPEPSLILTSIEAPNRWKWSDSSSSPRNHTNPLLHYISAFRNCLQPKRRVILQGKIHYL